MLVQKNRPISLRILIVFCYLSDFISLGFFAPFLVYLFFPRHYFVRYHSFCAMFLHLAGWIFAAPIRISSHLFVIEMDQYFQTPEELLSGLFSADSRFTIFLLIMISGMFLLSIIFLHGIFINNNPLKRKKYSISKMMSVLLIVILIVPAFFYTEGLWSAGDGFGQSSFFALNLVLFKDPYKLIPGHFILLWCMYLSWIAMRGQVFYFFPITKFFIKMQWSVRKTGIRRYKVARLRSLIFPGWGEFYDQKWLSGFATASCFLLGLMFLWISIGLLYSGFAEEISGLNANFTWYFLSQLGLRSHLFSDKQFLQIFSHLAMFVFLFIYLIVCYFYAWFSVQKRYNKKQIENNNKFHGFLQIASFGFLLHLIPIAILLLIPITISPLPMIAQALNRQKQQEQKKDQEPVMVIPDFYEHIDDEDANVEFSGQGGDNETTLQNRAAKSQKKPIDKDSNIDLKSQSAHKQKPRSKNQNKTETLNHNKSSESKRKGGRKKKNYSTYLSIRIRNIEKNLNYWVRQPKPYSAVFEYRISRTGRIYNVRLLEGSGYPKADQKTITLIQAMDPVLPPPGEHPVLVRELFWNTEPADKNLPTQMKRNLSLLFDGRSIERLGGL